MYTKYQLELKELLSENIVEVEFRKQNGEMRVMHCTLMKSHLPPVTNTKDSTPRRTSPHVTQVWDLEKNAWRSFKNDSVESYKVVSK